MLLILGTLPLPCLPLLLSSTGPILSVHGFVFFNTFVSVVVIIKCTFPVEFFQFPSSIC